MEALERLVITGVLVGFKENYKALRVSKMGDSDVPGSGARGECPVEVCLASYLAKYKRVRASRVKLWGEEENFRWTAGHLQRP